MLNRHELVLLFSPLFFPLCVCMFSHLPCDFKTSSTVPPCFLFRITCHFGNQGHHGHSVNHHHHHHHHGHSVHHHGACVRFGHTAPTRLDATCFGGCSCGRRALTAKGIKRRRSLLYVTGANDCQNLSRLPWQHRRGHHIVIIAAFITIVANTGAVYEPWRALPPKQRPGQWLS